MKLPGNRSAGRKIAAPIQHIDFFPTVLRLANLTPPSALRGRDLNPLTNTAIARATRHLLGGAVPALPLRMERALSLTDERYRFIKAPGEELYDLERDPDEKQNIVSERGQAATAMRSALDALVAGRAIDAPSGDFGRGSAAARGARLRRHAVFVPLESARLRPAGSKRHGARAATISRRRSISSMRVSSRPERMRWAVC